MDSVRGMWNRDKDNIDVSRLNPQFRYLKIVINGAPLVLALGSIDSIPGRDGQAASTTENWYSASGELVRIRDGRIVATSGVEVADWRSTTTGTLPSWQSIAAAPDRLWFYNRTRDVMPGYHYGLKDAITITPIARPETKTPLVGVASEQLAWFRETGVTTGADDANKMQAVVYGVDLSRTGNEAVVYLEQCLSATVCLTLQRLPANKNAS